MQLNINRRVLGLAKSIAKNSIPLEQPLENALKSAQTINDSYGKVILDDASTNARNILNEISSSSQRKASILAGIPVSIKDNFNVKDSITTAGSKFLENYNSPYNATVVEKLIEHGAVPCLKANLDEFGMGSSMLNSAYGPCINPNHPEERLTPGGSSGASAVAVATGLVPIAIGSDTGGSVRLPASFCGVVGFKPTYGAISRYGLISYASSMDTPGIFATNVLDTAIVFNATHGHDPKDPTSIRKEVEQSNILDKVLSGKLAGKVGLELIDSMEKLSKEHVSLKGVVIGVPEEFIVEEMGENSLRTLQQVLNKLQSSGAEIRNVSIPSLKVALPCYYVIACAEASSNLSRYDGIRYGKRSQTWKNSSDKQDAHGSDLYALIASSRAQGFGREVVKRILTGCYVLSESTFHEYYGAANSVRHQLRAEFSNVFASGVHVLAGLTAPEPPFPLSNPPDAATMLINDFLTVPANLVGIPAISLPMRTDDGNSTTSTGLPVGLQILGQANADTDLLRIALGVEQVINNKNN